MPEERRLCCLLLIKLRIGLSCLLWMMDLQGKAVVLLVSAAEVGGGT